MAAEPPKVLCLYGSPRAGGNTDLLMDAFAAGVEEAGGVTDRLYLRSLKISPCREIYACREAGQCALRDDMQSVYEKLRTDDAIALASPVMFYGVSAQAKALIDRCQALWCLKYVAGGRVALGRLAERRGVFLGVGGSRGKSIFDGCRLTFRYFLDALDAKPWKELTYREIDGKGEITGHPTALAEARALGRELAEAIRGELREAAGGG